MWVPQMQDPHICERPSPWNEHMKQFQCTTDLRERERRVKKFINDTLLDIYKLIILNKKSFYKRPNLILLEIF